MTFAAENRDELVERLNRIHAAIGATVENDFTRFPSRIMTRDGTITLLQDFSGGLSDAEIANFAHSLIATIANYRAHLGEYGRQHGFPNERRKAALQVLDGSPHFCVIKDLFNREKHPERPPHNGGYSRRDPTIREIHRIMRLTGPPGGGPTPEVFATAEGIEVRDRGEGGSASVMITADIVYCDTGEIGDLHNLALQAVATCEAALETLLAGEGST
jgi:hypothetical protein